MTVSLCVPPRQGELCAPVRFDLTAVHTVVELTSRHRVSRVETDQVNGTTAVWVDITDPATSRPVHVRFSVLPAGADPAAVLFDALTAARTGHYDLVIVDTAGRLHTKYNLMAELQKMCRIAAREIPGAPHEVLLVIDATTGQNGLAQARQFIDRGGATGIILTKLDGTAKGGVVIAIARELGLPIQFVGVGEKVDDLLPFDPRQFVASLFES